MGGFIYSLTQMYKSWKHWPMCKAKQYSRIKPFSHISSQSWNWKPVTLHETSREHFASTEELHYFFLSIPQHELLKQELRNYSRRPLSCYSAKTGLWRECWIATVLQDFCVNSICLPQSPKKPLQHQKENLKAGRFCLSDFMTSKYI